MANGIDIEKLLIENYRKLIAEARKFNKAYHAITGKHIDSSANGTNENYSVHIDEEMIEEGQIRAKEESFHATYKRSLPTKTKILLIIGYFGRFARKREIAEKFAELERLDFEKDFVIQTVTNAISNLNKEKKVVNYKPDNITVKGGFWGLTKWTKDGEPLPEYQRQFADMVAG